MRKNSKPFPFSFREPLHGGSAAENIGPNGLSDDGAVLLGRAVRPAPAVRLSPGYENAPPPGFLRGARADLGLCRGGDRAGALSRADAAAARALVHGLYPGGKLHLCVRVPAVIIYCGQKVRR